MSEERKVVTALFCDLVGFTALSESADPEDVDRMLTRYFAMARSAIEAFGGVVEKFIGDAVVGVFGVPAAHEDDPERAIRAGLRIAEEAEHLTSLDGGPLRLRVGINTGETLVRLWVVPGSGERFLAGDAINTASRIQSVAPLMGVAVGQSTYDATRAVFEYADLPPAVLKGKTKPVPVFHAIAPRARLGTDVTRVHDGPFVGREIDLALLKGVFDKTVAASTVQLVTIVGEPGMGKSRLVAELSRYVDSRPELVTWRQGRCLAYGDGITFWALSEVVKAHAGILDSDDSEQASAKLEAVLPDTQRAWYRQRMLPLIGVAAASTAEREELFAAWTGFLEHVADDGPTVIVLEDLHWADEPMLDFLEHLADHATGVPLLVVGTARPELFERHSSYGSGLRTATSITLAPLSDDETSRLISGLLDAVAVPAEVQVDVLERAGGNPLFAEEYLRLLRDRGLLVLAGTSWALTPDADVPLPSTVQALLAARIDTLTPDAKALVADAAVVGKVFWDGALTAMSGTDAATVTAALRELTRKQLVRPARRSSIADQHEYAFWHVLTRDVAYAQLPRTARATKHLAAADWIEQTSLDRVEDVADVLAYHATSALDAAI
ncbi:MAG TPA: AAA family ATPase, partial [Microlunatus sp.]|nr:AAA family ATPase [Microlunatus sp.]